MAIPSAIIKKPPVFRLVFLQCVCAIALAAGCYLWEGNTAGLSALLGGGIATLPSAWFAWRAFHYSGTRDAERILGAFYVAEVGKFALMAILFALVFKLVAPLHAGVLFSVYIATLLVGIGASIWALPAPQMKSLQNTSLRDS